MHHTMSQILIHIGEFFIRWSNWHYKRVMVEPPPYEDVQALNQIYRAIIDQQIKGNHDVH